MNIYEYTDLKLEHNPKGLVYNFKVGEIRSCTQLDVEGLFFLDNDVLSEYMLGEGGIFYYELKHIKRLKLIPSHE